MGAAFERVLGEQTEEPLDEVQPGRVGGREVEVEAWVSSEPAPDRRSSVGREVVEDDVDLEVVFDTAIELAEKVHEVLGAVLSLDLRHDFSGSDVESREETERAVANVVVGLPFRHSEVHRQNRLGALEGLDLRLLVD